MKHLNYLKLRLKGDYHNKKRGVMKPLKEVPTNMLENDTRVVF